MENVLRIFALLSPKASNASAVQSWVAQNNDDEREQDYMQALRPD